WRVALRRCEQSLSTELNRTRAHPERVTVAGGKRMETQRRLNQRFQVDLELTLQSESTIWMGHLENVSDGGVFVASKELKPIGTEVELTLKLPGALLPIWA